jgi:hypothetical protein
VIGPIVFVGRDRTEFPAHPGIKERDGFIDRERLTRVIRCVVRPRLAAPRRKVCGIGRFRLSQVWGRRSRLPNPCSVIAVP